MVDASLLVQSRHGLSSRPLPSARGNHLVREPLLHCFYSRPNERATVVALANYLVAMFKETPLLSVITVVELMARARSVADTNFRYLEPMTLVGAEGVSILETDTAIGMIRAGEAHGIRLLREITVEGETFAAAGPQLLERLRCARRIDVRDHDLRAALRGEPCGGLPDARPGARARPCRGPQYL